MGALRSVLLYALCSLTVYWVLALVLTGLLLVGMNSDAGGLGLLTVAPLSLTHLFGALALGGVLFLRIRRVDARKAADARARTAAVFDLEG